MYPTKPCPVLTNTLVQSAAGAGAIDSVVVENAGTGYNNKEYTDIPIRGDWEINGGTQAKCTVKITSGSVESVTITTAGNVGIGGTVAPAQLLTVQGGSDPTIFIRHDSANNADSGKLAFGEADNNEQAWIKYDGSANQLKIETINTANALVMDRTNGKVTLAGPLKLSAAGTPGDGKVLTSDADGDATWEAAAGGGGTATLTVASGQTVTQGKGVAVNTSGQAIPYDWGADLKASEQYGELNPHIQGIDAADSGWYAASIPQNYVCFYDYNCNKNKMLFR